MIAQQENVLNATESHVLEWLKLSVLCHVYLSTHKERDNNFWWEYRKLKTMIHCYLECKIMQPLWESVCQSLKRLNSIITWPSKCIPRNMPTRQEIIRPHNDVSLTVHNDLNYRQLKWTSTEQINNMWCIYTMHYYLARKIRKLLIYSSIWMNLKNIILSEWRQPQRTCSMVAFTLTSRRGRSTEPEGRLAVT